MGSLLFHGGSCPASVETTDPDPTRDDSGNLAPKPWPHRHGRAVRRGQTVLPGTVEINRRRSAGLVLSTLQPSSGGTPPRFRRLCRVAVMKRSLPEVSL